MSAIEFVRNYDDLSTEKGSQFRFYCDKCGNGFLSSYAPNRLGVAGGLLRAVGDVFGGALGNVGDSALEIQRSVGGTQHDRALRDAVSEIKPLFNQCRRCGRWVCQEVCWNEARGLCKECAPVLAEEMASAQAEAMAEQASDRIRQSDMIGDMDVSATAVARCPACGATSQGGKFCAECGERLAPESTCAGCGAALTTPTRFCPECGARTGRT